MSSVSLAESAALVLHYLEGSGFCKTAGTFRRYNPAVVVALSPGPSFSWQAAAQDISNIFSQCIQPNSPKIELANLAAEREENCWHQLSLPQV